MTDLITEARAVIESYRCRPTRQSVDGSHWCGTHDGYLSEDETWCDSSLVVADDLFDTATKLLAVVEAVTTVHAEYFDMDSMPGEAYTNPEPEDVWRYDRDFRAALTRKED